MCDPNINNLVNVVFSNVNDVANWQTNGFNPITTVGGKLNLSAGSANTFFDRVLGDLSAANNRVRVKVLLTLNIRSIIAANENMCVNFALMDGADVIGQYNVYASNYQANDTLDYLLDRVFMYSGAVTGATLRIKVPEGFENDVQLSYVIADDYNYCEDNVRNYFAISEGKIDIVGAESAALILSEYKVGDQETLTPAFFSENNNPGVTPSAANGFYLAKADIDGSNRAAELTEPNTWNPFIEEWGLTFDNANYFDGKPTGTTSGSDYGEGILNVGTDKPVVLNGNLEERPGAFFIDVDFEQNLKIVFDFLVNYVDKTNVFNNPSIYRRYTIEWNAATCTKSFYYTDQIRPTLPPVDVLVDGWLSGLTGFRSDTVVVACDSGFNYNGQSGTFEFEIDFGLATGQAGIDWSAFGVPDKFDIEWNGIMITTGYVGNSNFDQDLINAGIPPSEINTTPTNNASGQLLFNKTTATPTRATIRVTAPLTNTSWAISGVCPTAPDVSQAEITPGICDSFNRNWQTIFLNLPTLVGYTPTNGDIIYTDNVLSNVFVGDGVTTYRYRFGSPISVIWEGTFTIDANGVIGNATECNGGGGPGDGEITTLNETVDNCYTCWAIEVQHDPSGTNTVQFISSFAPAGVYAAGFCSAGTGIEVIQDATVTITEDTVFIFGIDGVQPGAIQNLSTIDVIVRVDGTVSDFNTYSRGHAAQNC